MRTLAAALIATALGAAGAPPAHAAVLSIEGTHTAAPDRFDRVHVETFGRQRAKTVLLLLAGGYAGAGQMEQLAADVAKRSPDTQPWVLVRRDQNLEDRTGLGAPDPLGYYLRGDTVNGRRFAPWDQANAPWARQWGLAAEMADVRRVVRAARRRGLEVVLGGHSFGATEAEAYATWDFGGHPGGEDLSGLVLLDGGIPKRPAPSTDTVRHDQRALAAGSPFANALGFGPPYLSGVFSQAAALATLRHPAQRSALYDSPLLIGPLKPPVPVTNAALLGYLFDRDSVAPGLEYAAARLGRLAATGDPRGWQDGELSSVDRVARGILGSRYNGLTSYYPQHLYSDLTHIRLGAGSSNRLLGLRPTRAARLYTPLLAIASDLSPGSVLRDARALVRRSRIAAAHLVDLSGSTSHLDLLLDRPPRSRALRELIVFLQRIR